MVAMGLRSKENICHVLNQYICQVMNTVNCVSIWTGIMWPLSVILFVLPLWFNSFMKREYLTLGCRNYECYRKT